MKAWTHYLLLPKMLEVEQLLAVEGDCRFAGNIDIQLQGAVLQCNVSLPNLQRQAVARFVMLVPAGSLLVQVRYKRMRDLKPLLPRFSSFIDVQAHNAIIACQCQVVLLSGITA